MQDLLVNIHSISGNKKYVIPADIIGNKTSVTVKIDANYGRTAGRIFGYRILKSDN